MLLFLSLDLLFCYDLFAVALVVFLKSIVVRSLNKDDGDAVGNVNLKKTSISFTSDSRDTLKSFSLFLTVKTTSRNWVWNTALIEIYKISHRRSLSPDDAKFGHFTLLLCRTLRNLQRFITHVHSHRSAHSTFYLLTVCCRCRRGFLQLPTESLTQRYPLSAARKINK